LAKQLAFALPLILLAGVTGACLTVGNALDFLPAGVGGPDYLGVTPRYC